MWAWRIGSIRGIALKIHVTFPLVLLWAMFQFRQPGANALPSALFGTVLVLLLFGCVLLHELGHALMARRFGIVVDDITLLPIGGLARLRAMRDDPKQEFAIALAGPLVNVAIAVALLPLLAFATDVLDPALVAQVAERRGSILLAVLGLLARAAQGFSVAGALAYLFFANVMLVAFNLLPAFPMDGGRVFRALLAMVLPYRPATIVAVRLGQGLAILFALWGVRYSASLLLVALFIFLSAGSELRRVALREVLTRSQVRAFMGRVPEALPPEWSLHAARLLARHTGNNAFPVVDDGRLLGLLTIREMGRSSSALTVGDAMQRRFPVLPPTRTLYDAQLDLQGNDQFAGAVMEGGELLGLLSLEDIERAYHALQGPARVRWSV